VSIDVTQLRALVDIWTTAAKAARSAGGEAYGKCARQLGAIVRADEWNERHPIGVDVVVETVFATKTRGAAYVRPRGEHALVMVKGLYFEISLDLVRPAADKAFEPARDCLHEGACSARSQWACTQHDSLTSREGFERPKWRCACGPCHEPEGAESAADELPRKEEP